MMLAMLVTLDTPLSVSFGGEALISAGFTGPEGNRWWNGADHEAPPDEGSVALTVWSSEEGAPGNPSSLRRGEGSPINSGILKFGGGSSNSTLELDCEGRLG